MYLVVSFTMLLILCYTFGYKSNHQTRLGNIGGRKMIHGVEAVTIHPCMISVQVQGHHNCGGSLIAPKWVLTAAHCFFTSLQRLRIPDKYFTTVRGTLKLDETLDAEIRKCKKAYLHENYDKHENDPDIALIELDEIYNSTEYAVLPTSQTMEHSLSSYEKICCKIMGWGITSPDVEKPNNKLMEVDIELISGKRCQRYNRLVNEFSEVCALDEEKTACQGDSGGPLMCKGYQFGVISWGMRCSPQAPLVFTRPDFYSAWISHTMNSSNLLIQNMYVILICFIIINFF